MNLKSFVLVEFEEIVGHAADRFHAPENEKRLTVLNHTLARLGEIAFRGAEKQHGGLRPDT
jgi:hypothetical protein